MKTSYIIISIVLISLNSFAQYEPVGAVHPYADKPLLQTPSEKPWAAARCDAATINKGDTNDGVLEVDFMEVISEDLATGVKTVITREDYNNDGEGLTTHEGGLYKREPWFVENDTPRLMTNAIQSNEYLVIRVGEEPNFISHFWSDWKKNDPSTRLQVRIRFRITGQIGFQFGLDYAPTSDGSKNDHTEAFYSRWYGNTNGEFLTETYPNYDESISFDREHYGFYTNGKFFMSRQMADYKNATVVELKTDATNWQPKVMTLNNDRYEFDTGQRITRSTYYCFRLNQNENFHIPALFMLSGDNLLVHPEDAISNGTEYGYNFYTSPVVPLSSEISPAQTDLQLSLSPDSVYLYIRSPHKIKRIFIVDMAGRISYDNRHNISEEIVIAGLNRGTYIVNIETDKGIFAEKFVK
ncbi:MAG: T9SS type A sorting domain-containing protein [Mariniphaga sp.]|nr:T9SS type A sorting domain-containing protein [Mariniphaga sp.]